MTAHISALPPHVAISGSRVYATQGGIYTLDGRDGTLLQSYPIKDVRACVVIDDVLYANAANGRSAVQAFHTQDGTLLWSYPAQRLTEVPVVVNGIVYACDIGKGSIYAIQAHTGTLLWSYLTGRSLHTFPVIAGGVVYLTPTTNPPEQAYVYALRARHGSQLWRVPIPEASNVPLVVDRGIVYICTHRRCIALQGWDGSLLWQREYAPEGATPSEPVEKDGILYVGGSVLSGPILQDGVLYLCLHGVGYEQQDESATTQGFSSRLRRALYLCALETRRGKPLWQRRLETIPSSTPVLMQGILSSGPKGSIYLSGNNGVLSALSTEDGSVLWHYQTGGEMLSQATLADGLVYVGASDGYVYALGVKDGQLRWKSFVSTEVTTTYYSRQIQSNRP